MTRFALLTIAAVSLIAFSSCRKQRNCICTDGFDTSIESVGVTTKQQAKNRCNLLEATYSGAVTCTLQE